MQAVCRTSDRADDRHLRHHSPRHAGIGAGRHDFDFERQTAVTIKAVVFDAYGTLYDIQSVADVTEQAFPGYGDIITQIWRIKQLEYSWLRSLMQRYQEFSAVTRESLAYTLRVLGLTHDDATFAAIIDKYLHLDLYPDALQTLTTLKK